MIYDLRFTVCDAIRLTRRGLTLAGFAVALTFALQASSFPALEGRIHAVTTQGGSAMSVRYTVGTNFLRIELTDTNRPNPVDILDRNSGIMILLFPHNRSFVRLKPLAENSSVAPPGFPSMPNGLPSGIGPTNLSGMPAIPNPPASPALPAGSPPGIAPQGQLSTTPGTPAIPAMPNMPTAGGMPPMLPTAMMPLEKMKLKATGETTNLLGYACEKFEIKQRGETMEIWATDQLLPFQNYVRNQTPRFGSRMIEEQWAGLLTAKKLFPLRASLHFENGPERYRFEVQSIKPQKLTKEDQKLFQPPEGYFEIQPLPF